MIKILKVGNYIYENIEKKTVQPTAFDENGNPTQFEEVSNPIIPQNTDELRQCIADTLVWMEKQRLQKILNQYGYFSLADVQFYANQNDAEAQSILSWYQAYDDAIWNWTDNDLQAFTTVDELLALDMKAIEEQIYQDSITASPLP